MFAQTRPQEARPFDLDDDVPARTSIIEFNPIPNAVSYQVEIRPQNRVWAHNYKFDIPGEDPKLKIRLNPGQYALRTRSFDAFGFFGPWSHWQKFWIHYESVDAIYPADGSTVKPKSGFRELLQFEWPIDPKAHGYLFVLRDEAGKALHHDLVRTPWNLVELELSARYSWTYEPIYSAAQMKKPADQIPPPERDFYTFKMEGPAPGTRDMNLKSSASPRALKYQYEFLKLDRVGERGSSAVYESTTPEFKIAMAPGTYEVRVRTFFDDRSISDWSPPWKFFVPYEKVKTISPEDGQKLDPNDFEYSFDLTWKAQNDVNHYMVYIYNDKGEFIRSYMTEETKVQVSLPHNRSYRWLVIPYSAGQSEIKPPEMPDYAPSFSIENYIPLKMSSSEEPSHLYAWGRYYTSLIDYEGRNYDLNSKVAQPIYGGTGELALGYWHRKSHLGLLTHAGLSGFLIGNTTYNYGYAGLHLGYRHMFDSGSRLRIWAGYTYMEFPEFLRDPFVQNYDYHRVKSAGPQLQISYMGDFLNYPKFGWHMYGVAYQSRQSIQTPNGLDQIPQLSYTLGIFGTYKWTDNQKWMIGYAYKEENIRYKSTDRSGLDNYSFTKGHFLNLSIEIGLSKEHFK
ncbi:MAG: hypothetical protein AB7F86_19075 [Bdellovibrionales bacterium]